MAKGKKTSNTPLCKKLLIAAIAAAAVGGGAIYKNINYIRGEKVIQVVDGDTFIIENHQPIRLYGLNAPELTNCLGKEAKEALSALILNKRVQLREPVTDKGTRRVMTLVYDGTILINEVMIRAGMAEYNHQGGSQTKRMDAANTYTRSNHIGIFSPVCVDVTPPDTKCVIKGNYNAYERKKMYYTPACNHYSLVEILKYQGDRWFCTETEAQKAGFEKSVDCK